MEKNSNTKQESIGKNKEERGKIQEAIHSEE